MNLYPKLAGANFRPAEAKDVVRNLEVGDKVSLEREPDNPYDANAIRVLAEDEFIGFLQRDLAAVLAPRMDDGLLFRTRVHQRLSDLVVIFEVEPVPETHSA